MISSCIVLLIGNSPFAVFFALAGVLIGLESRVALKENSVSGLRVRSWWAFLYCLIASWYALSVDGEERHSNPNSTLAKLVDVNSTRFFAIEARCLGLDQDKEKEDCNDLTVLYIWVLSTLSGFLFLNGVALRQFASHMENRRRDNQSKM
jgi:hypothetical protein|tara:strand:+ start:214 stop:663 length:450 start_codon:yes stop_codon:yes gene_type:complete